MPTIPYQEQNSDDGAPSARLAATREAVSARVQAISGRLRPVSEPVTASGASTGDGGQPGAATGAGAGAGTPARRRVSGGELLALVLSALLVLAGKLGWLAWLPW